MYFQDTTTGNFYEGEPAHMFGLLLEGGSPILCESVDLKNVIPAPDKWASKELYREHGVDYDAVGPVIFSMVVQKATAI